ncbi:hypothetical protein LV75_003907 [Actinokineospora diospyrosa]|uniref:Uncharacterized protein n=1 Tax=Actinokineospora diospyrosa TaxID=103728 RepID=A0ABT1IFG1_9PSEU|nr:hypothetical protein [Actinokineospora diospyrosa]
MPIYRVSTLRRGLAEICGWPGGLWITRDLGKRQRRAELHLVEALIVADLAAPGAKWCHSELAGSDGG